MGKFASGKNALAISDRSGFQYRYKDMRREWNGLLVGKDEFEPKQPQLGPFRTVSDPQALKDARPDRVEPPVEVILIPDPFSISEELIIVSEPGNSRSTGDFVRFRNSEAVGAVSASYINGSAGHIITVISSSEYSFANVRVIRQTSGNLSTPMLRAAGDFEPEETLFNVVVNGRKLGDIDNNGSVNSNDSQNALQWESGVASDAVTAYIEGAMADYMGADANVQSYKDISILFDFSAKARGGGNNVTAGPVTLEP